MPLINRFTGILQGSMVLTGNTLAIRQGTAFPPATRDWLNGSYISTDTSLVATAGFPAGTTFLASKASSSAMLNMPQNSTVVYAQLYWTFNGADNNNSVTLNTPIGNSVIFPDTLLNQMGTSSVTLPLHWKARDVTTIVNNSGTGTYTLSPSNGPDIVDGSFSTGIQGTAWYLVVVYRNQSMPNRYINVNTGVADVSASAPSDFNFTNLVTPTSGIVKGYLIVSEYWGDLLDGATISVGPTLGTAVQVGNPSTGAWDGVAPYAQIDNMLPGNILIADCEDPNIGQLDTRGTFGALNKNPFNKTAPAFARTNADILGIDISNTLNNSQTTLFTRVGFVGTGNAELLSQSVQIDMNAATFTPMIKYVDKSFADIGETITYQVYFKNGGLATANDVVFIDTIPNATTFVTGSVIINGVPQVTENPTFPGIYLGTLVSGQDVTISFKVVVDNTIPDPNPITNNSGVTYNFIPGVGQAIQYSHNESNSVNTQINTVTILSSKIVDKYFATVGDILTYTIPIRVLGNVSANNVVIIDTIPSDLTVVSNSLIVNGVSVPGNTNPPLGLALGTLPVNTIVTVSYKILVNSIPSINPIVNYANIGYNYIVDPGIPIIKIATTKTNDVQTQINSVNLNDIKKYVDKVFAVPGDTINYTIVVKNKGNIQAENVMFRDTLPNGTAFITDSVYINMNQKIGYNPNSGFTVPNIDQGSTTTITFSVIIL